ncbi:MAG: tRNA pseudouridine(38-40) synthase TruA [Lachnospiraceae bacterium]|nr:tRNA pseudouridine(38-40) synthase TruA [Lachnospiraceae bacterium]
MSNYKMVLQYEGTRYQGWQRQESTGNTIQGKIEALLGRMCGAKVEIQGSGRTDAGVHAKGQIANVHMQTDKTPAEIMEYMNRYLPEDIGVISVTEVSERFHSRLNAKGKTYCYQIINSTLPHVFDRRYSYVYPEKLNLEAMRQAAEVLMGTHDFASFTSAKKGKKSTVRTIEDIRMEEDGDIIRIFYSGDGFLFHMVRILTGTLLEVGIGERTPKEMETVLQAKKRECAGFLVPASGLTLLEVRY